MTTLHFEDQRSADDFATFVRRALRVAPDGALRLQTSGTVLASWVEVLPGRSLTHTGLTLGLRVQRLTQPADLDIAVALVAVRDRLARGVETVFFVPPQQVSAPWLGISAPRSGWEPAATIAVARLQEIAREGIAEVAAGTPVVAGAAAVANLRERVWGRVPEEGMPAGAAFAADALGFLVGDEASWHRCGRWGRLSTPAGFVLTR